MITPLLVLSMAGTAVAQQKEEKTKEKKSESITIRKNGDSKEKLTIVVDGDKVTVNGKPLDEFKDGNVSIIHGDNTIRAMVSPRVSVNGLNRLQGIEMERGGAKALLGQLSAAGGNKALLGVTTEKDDKGAKVTEITKESAAEKTGLKIGDVITKVGDSKIEDASSLYKAVGKYKPEDKAEITYLRDGKEGKTTATLGKNKEAGTMTLFGDNNFNFEMPRVTTQGMDGFNFNYMTRKGRLGLQIQDLEDGKGVKVLDVDEDTPAAKAGLKKDDVITEIDGKELKSVDDLRTKARDMKEGDSFKVQYKRDGKTQSAEIKFPRKLKTADL